MAEQAEERLAGMEQAQQNMQVQLKAMTEMLSKLTAASGGSSDQTLMQPVVVTPSVTLGPDQDNSVPNASTPIHSAPANQGTPTVVQISAPPVPVEESPVVKQLEARMKMVEGNDIYGAISPQELCLVKGFVLPPKFKVPEFEKYSGSRCPREHLTMYCRKMAAHVEDDKLLMHCFQDSLTGGALRWYNQLEGSRIKTWKDLATTFLNQYRHVTELTVDRLKLQSYERKDTEGFTDYARRWREAAMEVQPPLTEKELTSLFIGTLQGIYYEKLIGNVTNNFADLVASGERIESGIKGGKLGVGKTETVKKPLQPNKKKDGDANTVWQPYGGPPVNAFSAPTPVFQFPQQQQQGGNHYTAQQTQTTPGQPSQPNQKPKKQWLTFDPIPVSYANAFAQLSDAGLLSPVPALERSPPYPHWYKADARCAYHAGGAGHDIENCLALKKKIQTLKDAGWINLAKASNTPNVGSNPLPEHPGNVSNLTTDREDRVLKADEVKMQKEELFWILRKHGYLTIQEGQKEERFCLFHNSFQDHDIEECPQFQTTLQELMDSRRIEFVKQVGHEVHMASGGRAKLPEGFVPFTLRPTTSTPEIPTLIQGIKAITLQAPPQLPVTNLKAVPWNYGCQSITPEGPRTRSGKPYAQEAPPQQGKEKMARIEVPHKKVIVTEEDVAEFLKLIKHSDYSIIEQLHKQPAKISILSLLKDSPPHREALMKVLSEAFVPQSITVADMDHVVSHLLVDNYVSFGDEDLPEGGTGHIRALHISVKCKDHMMSRVLVDNGSSLNIMPFHILEQLPVDPSHMRPSNMVVRAFDGEKRSVLGVMDVPLQIGPTEFMIEFHVMQIAPYYSCLLGRPWIHTAKAVPSTLHQKIKFVSEDQLVCVRGEEEVLITKPMTVPYIEGNVDAPECSYRSFEVVNAVYVNTNIGRCFSKVIKNMAAVLLRLGHKAGQGLGKFSQGRKDPVITKGIICKYGLGYIPTKEDRKRQFQTKRASRWARLGWEFDTKEEKRTFPPLETTFRSAGFINKVDETVATLADDDQDPQKKTLVYKGSQGQQLNNWIVKDLPTM